MKYIVTTKSGEIVYGGDGICNSKRSADALAEEMVSADYGEMTIYKLILEEKVSKRIKQRTH